MKIDRIRLQNFRAFDDDTFKIGSYACFVGANGAGKSTVLAALNVFFREQAAPGRDPMRLDRDDFRNADTSQPIRITVHFTDLSDEAKSVFADYFRHGELVVTAVAEFDPATSSAPVQHYGERLVMNDFREYFGREKGGALVSELETIYAGLQDLYPELPDARTKVARVAELLAYETRHPELCSLVPSRDEFYGTNSTGKLARFVQWVYVPAVKDVSLEGMESKTSALGRLIRRTVNIHTDVEEKLQELERDAVERYQSLLDEKRVGLDGVAASLQARLTQWAHPNVRLELDWLQDAKGAVRLQAPVVGVRTGEGLFLASLSHMGHGLQRSYLLAVLQELAASEATDAPTLILGCEEPELYQHPPQARYLAQVFQELATANNQIIVTTHSPHFAAGRGFEDVRLVRRQNGTPVVTSLAFSDLCDTIRRAGGDDPDRPIEGLIAKINQALQPAIAEMLFCQVPVLVEGLEDVAYITAQLLLGGQSDEFRRLGCHLIASNGKDKLVQPVAITASLGLPAFLVFDSDGNIDSASQRPKHERDNRTLMALKKIDGPPFPDQVLRGSDYTIWPENLTRTVHGELGEEGERIRNEVRLTFADEGGLEKNTDFIGEYMERAFLAGLVSPSLQGLVAQILTHAASVAKGTG
jgi:putative ATP-dependent endonuclease of OLD family